MGIGTIQPGGNYPCGRAHRVAIATDTIKTQRNDPRPKAQWYIGSRQGGSHRFRARASSLDVRQFIDDHQKHFRGVGHTVWHGQADRMKKNKPSLNAGDSNNMLMSFVERHAKGTERWCIENSGEKHIGYCSKLVFCQVWSEFIKK